MKNKSGFTLIELMVLIAIIGILGAMILCSFEKAKLQGHMKTLPSQYSNPYPPSSEASAIDGDGETLKLGETVYIDNMNVTGKVNSIYYDNTYHDQQFVDLLIENNASGAISTLNRISPALLKKVSQY